LDPLLGGVIWPRVTENLEFLDIDSQLTNGLYPFRERMEVWHRFDNRFLGLKNEQVGILQMNFDCFNGIKIDEDDNKVEVQAPSLFKFSLQLISEFLKLLHRPLRVLLPQLFPKLVPLIEQTFLHPQKLLRLSIPIANHDVIQWKLPRR
jgi:hypothetical protein